MRGDVECQRLFSTRRGRDALDQAVYKIAPPGLQIDDGGEPDHRAAEPRRAIALFMLSMETAFERLPNMPLISRTPRLLATISWRPGAKCLPETDGPSYGRPCP